MTDPTPPGATPPVEAALDHIAAEYRTQDGWARDLLAEHARVQARLAQLKQTYLDLTAVLPPDRARARVQDLTTLLPPLALRTQGPRTPRSHAIETFLSVHRHDAFGPQDLSDWLRGQGIAFSRERCGTELGRRARDGYLERVGRGRYRVVV